MVERESGGGLLDAVHPIETVQAVAPVDTTPPSNLGVIVASDRARPHPLRIR